MISTPSRPKDPLRAASFSPHQAARSPVTASTIHTSLTTRYLSTRTISTPGRTMTPRTASSSRTHATCRTRTAKRESKSGATVTAQNQARINSSFCKAASRSSLCANFTISRDRIWACERLRRLHEIRKFQGDLAAAAKRCSQVVSKWYEPKLNTSQRLQRARIWKIEVQW